MENSLVSIVIPVYNTQKYLSECLDSIINQSYKNLEIIVINDGSTDNSQNIIDEYVKKDKRIISIYQNNSGVSAARNSGLDNSSGDYVCFVDSDDFIRKDFIENLINVMSKYNADVTTTKSNLDDVNIENVEVLDADKALVRMYYGKLEKSDNGVQMFSLKLLKENNITFDEDKKVCEDFDFFAKALIVSNKIAVDYRSMYYYRPNPDSVMHKALNINNFKAINNKIEAGLTLVDRCPGLKSAIENSIFCDSVSLAVRGYSELNKWQKQFKQIWYNLRRYKWLALMNKNTNFKFRMSALLYCIFGNKLSTIILRSIKNEK